MKQSSNILALTADAILHSLRGMSVDLRRVKIRKHHADIGKMLWQSGMAAFHIQDDRLTDKEQRVLARLATKLYGCRALGGGDDKNHRRYG